MGVSLFMARKLQLSSGGRKSSPAVRVAVAAVALSVIVMLSAIAIVTGFKSEITDKVSGFNSDISIFPASASVDDVDEPDASSAILSLTPTLAGILDAQPYITDYALQASVPAIFKTDTDFKGIYLKSLSGRNLENFIAESVVEGNMPDYAADSCRDDIVISRKAAIQLGLHAGDRIDTYFMTDAITVRRLDVAAVFDSHFDSYDDSFAYCSLPLVQDLGRLSPSQGTSIAVSVKDFDNVDAYGQDLQETLVKAYADESIYRLLHVNTARRAGAAYFQWLDLLDMNVVVVLVLMTVVSCVTLISGMLILMVDKIRFIALMSALGAPRRIISRIFMLMAARIALYGLLIGDAVAIVLLYLQERYHIVPLDADTYYIDFVPVRLSFPSILILNLAIAAVIWLALIIPSRFAGKAAPARTLATE